MSGPLIVNLASPEVQKIHITMSLNFVHVPHELFVQLAMVLKFIFHLGLQGHVFNKSPLKTNKQQPAPMLVGCAWCPPVLLLAGQGHFYNIDDESNTIDDSAINCLFFLVPLEPSCHYQQS